MNSITIALLIWGIRERREKLKEQEEHSPWADNGEEAKEIHSFSQELNKLDFEKRRKATVIPG